MESCVLRIQASIIEFCFSRGEPQGQVVGYFKGVKKICIANEKGAKRVMFQCDHVLA